MSYNNLNQIDIKDLLKYLIQFILPATVEVKKLQKKHIMFMIYYN